jgi:hypothetical protein
VKQALVEKRLLTAQRVDTMRTRPQSRDVDTGAKGSTIPVTDELATNGGGGVAPNPNHQADDAIHSGTADDLHRFNAAASSAALPEVSNEQKRNPLFGLDDSGNGNIVNATVDEDDVPMRPSSHTYLPVAESLGQQLDHASAPSDDISFDEALFVPKATDLRPSPIRQATVSTNGNGVSLNERHEPAFNALSRLRQQSDADTNAGLKLLSPLSIIQRGTAGSSATTIDLVTSVAIVRQHMGQPYGIFHAPSMGMLATPGRRRYRFDPTSPTPVYSPADDID